MMLKFHKANEEGKLVGEVLVNLDLLCSVNQGSGPVELRMADGCKIWVTETFDEVLRLCSK